MARSQHGLAFSLVGIILGMSACFNPEHIENLQCSSEGLCPGEMVCGRDNICGQPGPDASIDAPTPRLTQLLVSGAVLSPGFDPEQTLYQIDASVLLSKISITAVASAETVLRINGNEVASGVALPISLSLGSNEIEVQLDALGKSETYTVEIDRGAKIVEQITYGKSSNTDSNDGYGNSVALHGNTLVVGAPSESSDATDINGDQSNNNATNSGAVYVFRLLDGVWRQEAYIKAFDTAQSDNFGTSVALFDDTLVVGAPLENGGGRGVNGDQTGESIDSGAVYIFRRTNGEWAQEAYVKAENRSAEDKFGGSVAIYGDLVAVGAQQEDGSSRTINGMPDNLRERSGAVYLFRRNDAQWVQEAYVKSSNSGINDRFGGKVAVFEDIVIASAIREDGDGDSSPGSGATYVFRQTDSVWAQEAYLRASNSGTNDRFGTSIAIGADTIVVGAAEEDGSSTGINSEDDNSAVDSGAVYVFHFQDGGWEQEAYIKASNTGLGDQFGSSLALAGDLLVVGSVAEAASTRGVDGNQTDDSFPGSGAAYLYRRDGTTWSQEAYIKAFNTTGGDAFGFGLALSETVLVVGAVGEDSSATAFDGDYEDNAAPGSGAIYLFH